MKYTHIVFIGVLSVILHACIEPFYVYFRNFTNKAIVIDVCDYVQWIDTAHFRYVMKPGITIFANDLAGSFINSTPQISGIITITKGNKTDTLLDSKRVYRNDLFSFKYNFPFRNILCYDVK